MPGCVSDTSSKKVLMRVGRQLGDDSSALKSTCVNVRMPRAWYQRISDSCSRPRPMSRYETNATAIASSTMPMTMDVMGM